MFAVPPDIKWNDTQAYPVVVVVQLLSCDPIDSSTQASLSFTISQSLFKLMSIESMMPSNHLILCPSLLLLPSIFPSIRVFSSEKALEIPLDNKEIQPVHSKEISPEYSLEGLMLKLKLQYFGHLM